MTPRAGVSGAVFPATAAPPTVADPRLRFLEAYRLLSQAVLRGDPLPEIGRCAARAVAAALGPHTNVLVLAAAGQRYDILGSAGPVIGVLDGQFPRRQLPEAGAAMASGHRLTVRACGVRHPISPHGRAYLAPLVWEGAAVGVIAAWLPADARYPETESIIGPLGDVTGAVVAALARAASVEPPLPSLPAGEGVVTVGQPYADLQRLREEVALLHAVVDALPYAAVVAGTDGRTLLRNRAARQHDDELPGAVPAIGAQVTLAEAAPQRNGFPQVRSERRAVAGAATPYDARYRVRDPATGRDRWATTTAVPLRGPDGALCGVLSLTRDVTEVVEAEEEREWLLQETQAQRELLNRLVEAAPVSILLLDAELRVRLANRRVLDMIPHAVRSHGVLGHPIHEIAPRPAARWFTRIVTNVMERRQEFQRGEVAFHYEGVTTYWDIAAVPISDASGAVSGVLFCAHDVTDRVLARQAEQRLLANVQAERARINTVLDLVPAGVVAMDGACAKLTYVNHAALALAARPGATVGGAAVNPQGQSFWDFVDAAGRVVEAQETPLGRALHERRAVEGEQLALRQPDGRLVPVMVSAAPLPPGPGGGTGAVMVFVDITPLKEVERLKDDLLAVASHDLRTPLTVIAGRLQLLRQQLSINRTASDRTLASLTLVQDHVQQLTELAAALLDVTRIQSGRLQVHPAPVDLAALVHRVAAPLARASARHPVALDLPGEGLVGQWEAERLAQVVQNLLQNAIKYSPDGGPIMVRLRREETPGGAYAVLTVTDRGIGIAPEERTRIFDRFARGDGARRLGLPGSGLGLYICWGIVQAHGGTISVDSAPGGGSIFTVRLPIGSPPGAGP